VYKLTLKINKTYYWEQSAETCDNVPYVWTGHSVAIPTVAGTHVIWDSLKTVSNCDSVYKLTLKINKTYYWEQSAETCDNVPYVWTGHSVPIPTVAGTHVIWDSLKTVSNCDSVYKLTLKINKTYYWEQSAETCDNVPYVWTGHSVSIPTVAGTHIIWDSLKTASNCDSVYKLTLKIKKSYNINLQEIICQTDLPYSWRDITFNEGTVTGDYVFHRHTVDDCDSIVTLHLIVNSPQVKLNPIPEHSICEGGNTVLTASLESVNGNVTYKWSPASSLSSSEAMIVVASPASTTTYKLVATAQSKIGTLTCIAKDSIETTIKVKTVYHVNDYKSICQSELPIVWNGETFTAPGVKTAVLPTADGCDSIVTMTLVANPKTYGDTIAVACESFTWHGVTYTTTPLINPTYTMVGGNKYGCDSIVTLKLTVNHPVHTATSVAAYDSYTWHGTPYTTSGTYTYSHLDEHDCTQVDTLHLIIDISSINEFSAVECISYKWNDSIYKVSGDYQQTLKNIHGLDSVVTLHLIINNPAHEAESIIACDKYTWHENTYTVSGDYQYSHTDANGCLQVDTLHLTINHSNSGIDEQVACDSYKWIDGNIYTESTNTPTYTLTNSEGCDSVVTLHLTINKTTVSVETHTDEVCGGDGGIIVSATGKPVIQFSIDGGMTFQTSVSFTGLSSGSYEVLAVDANGCSAKASVVVASALIPTLTITCPPDIHDTLDFGDCIMKISPEDVGTPIVAHSLGWPFTVTHNLPSDSLYAEGDNLIKWVMTDLTCGYKDSCEQHVFVIFPKCPDAVDCEGNIYHSVRIDCDCWTQRNLESKKYSDCTNIPCVYNYVSYEYPDVTENVNIYGRLYCFEAAVRDSADNGHGHIQGVCPAGWYLPTPEKFNALNAYGASAVKSPLYWIPVGGDNSTGFSSLPGGYYNGNKERYENLRGEAYYWATQNTGSATSISFFEIFFDCNVLIEGHTHSGVGFSVRCIKEKD
ncbi:MAG: fibrobacter succinogenes major paralogous domain-containing protein, partial [Bacteroidales bacterium]|nr:fibrobacter succinogenes major paralogous domain-containing protein [Bacteroidales bacterium]